MIKSYLLVLAIFFYSANLIYSSDKIITKSGLFVECKVIGEDSLYVNLIIMKNGNEIKTKIKKDEILHINYENAEENKQNINDTALKKKTIIYPFLKHNISFSMGPGLVFGELASTDVNKNPGYATNDFINFSMNYTYKYNKIFEFEGKIIRGFYKFNSNTFITQYKSVTGADCLLNANGWTTNCFFIGLAKSIQLSQFQIECRLMPGLILLKSPLLKFSVPSKKIHFDYPSNYGMNLGYNIGIGTKYLLYSKWGIQLDCDVSGTTIEMFDIKATASNGTEQLIKGSHYNFNNLNLALGVFYNFEFK
jgi:hypothetical protein